MVGDGPDTGRTARPAEGSQGGLAVARQARRTRPGDSANLFIRCLLSDAGELLGGLAEDEWRQTLDHFGSRCAYTDVPLTLETAVKDHAIPINKTDCGLHLFGNVLP